MFIRILSSTNPPGKRGFSARHVSSLPWSCKVGCKTSALVLELRPCVICKQRQTNVKSCIVGAPTLYTNTVDAFWQNNSFDSRVWALKENDIVTLTTVSACRSGSPSISHVILGAGTEPQDSHSICCTLPAENAMPRLTLMWTFFGFTATWAMAKIKLGLRDWMEQNYTHAHINWAV